jgi:hypothetical protein
MVPHTADTLVEEVLAKMEGLDWGATEPVALLEVVAGRLLGFRHMLASKGRTAWEAAVVTPEHRAQLWELLREAYSRYHSRELAVEVPPLLAPAPLSLLGLGDQQQQAAAGEGMLLGTPHSPLPMMPAAAAAALDVPAAKRSKVVTTGGVTHTPAGSALVPSDSPCFTTLAAGASPLVQAGSGTGDVQYQPDQQQQGSFDPLAAGWGGSSSRGLPVAQPATSGCVGMSLEAPGGFLAGVRAPQQQQGMPPELAAALQQYGAAAQEAVRQRKRVRAILEEYPQLQMAVAQVSG